VTILIMPRSSHPRSVPVPRLEPDERDRLADDLDQEKPCP